MQRFRRYLTYAIATLAAGGIVTAAFCLVVDPYRMLDLVAIGGFNERKPQASLQIQIAKAYDVRRARPDAILLGNSRVEVGLDPAHPAFRSQGLRPFNLGIPGAGMYEQFRNLQHATHQNRIRLLIVGLDYVDFLQRKGRMSPLHGPVQEFEARLLVDRDGRPNAGRPLGMLKDANVAFFSLNALADGLLTMAGQGTGSGDRTRLGFNPLDEYRDLVALEGHRSLFVQRDRENLRQRINGPKSFRDENGRPGQGFEMLNRMLDLARAQGATVLLYIHPYHARLLETFRLAGLWSDFQSWKVELANAVAAEASREWKAPPVLWDFADYSRWTTEKVPGRGDRRTRMNWYWEAGHYKSELGNLLLGRMLEHAGPEEFGNRLDPRNVAGRNGSVEASREAYLARFASDVEELRSLAR